jgi:hypothetical protein
MNFNLKFFVRKFVDVLLPDKKYRFFLKSLFGDLKCIFQNGLGEEFQGLYDFSQPKDPTLS